MAKKTRRSSKRGSLHIASRVMAPVGFVLNAAGSSVKHAAHATGKIVRTGFHGVRKIGNSIASGANKMVNQITRRRKRRS